MRFLALLVCIGVTSSVFASYELALMVDNNNGQIQRYDMTNGVMLGTFGRGRLGYYSDAKLALDPNNRNEVAVFNGDGSVSRFNWSTGARTSIITLDGLAGNLYGNSPFQFDVRSDGNYVIQGYTGNFRSELRLYYASTGGLFGGPIQLGTNTDFMDVVVNPDDSMYALTRRWTGSNYAYSVNHYDSGGNLINALSNFYTTSDWNAFNSIEVFNGEMHLLGGNTDVNYLRGTMAGLTGVGGSYYLTGNYHEMMHGHNGESYFLQSWSDAGVPATRIYYRHPQGLGFFTPYADLPNGINYGSAVMVTAPEPATMVALAAGAAYFLRRRRK